MTTLPWLLIPGFLVALLAWTHLLVFGRLRDGRSLREVPGSETSAVEDAEVRVGF